MKDLTIGKVADEKIAVVRDKIRTLQEIEADRARLST